MSRVPVLTDGVVTLRAHRDDDAPRVIEQSADAESIRWTIVPVPYGREDALTFIRHLMPGGWGTDLEWGFAVEFEGRYAGTVTLRDREQRRAELAFGSHPDVRGHGVMERAVRLLLEWGFSPASDGGRGLETVIWYAHVGNWSSRRLAWRTGFTYGGILRGWIDHRGTLKDVWSATLRREDPREPARPWLDIPVIDLPNARLRPPRPDDAPRVMETYNDPETARWMSGSLERLDLPAAERFLHGRLEAAADANTVTWTVADPDTDVLQGLVNLFDIRTRGEFAEIGYWTHPECRGRGVATAAAGAALRHAFIDQADGGLGLPRVSALAMVDNAPSRAVLETIGMTQSGVQRARLRRRDGSLVDAAAYEVLAPGL